MLVSNATSVTRGTPLTFTATVVTGTGKLHEWDFKDGTTASGAADSISHTYTTTGSFEAEVTVSNERSSLSDDVVITVTEVPISGLQATNSGSMPLGLQGATVHFTATYIQGTNPSFLWTFGDTSGEVKHTQNVTHTYVATGTFVATAVAWNEAGFTSTVTSVTINEPLLNSLPAGQPNNIVIAMNALLSDAPTLLMMAPASINLVERPSAMAQGATFIIVNEGAVLEWGGAEPGLIRSNVVRNPSGVDNRLPAIHR
jgi:PKD repeat protein